jgi:LmbE family N-acetylglucosaminyl deacetylase
MQVFLSPHPDDAVLFASYLIMRVKPLVVTVTHPTLQGDNGNERVLEDYAAMRMLGAPIAYLGIDEDKLTEELLLEKLQVFSDDTMYYIPEYEENGNPQHNLVHNVVKGMTNNYKEYKTYSGWNDRSGDVEVIPTERELELKKAAMACYKTQIENQFTSHYFETYAEYR